MNIENFLTVLAWIWVACWLFGFISVSVIYCSMSKLERAFTKVDIKSNGVILFVVAIAWLVTR